MKQLIGAGVLILLMIAGGLLYFGHSTTTSAKTALTVRVTLSDFKIVMSTHRLPAGSPVKFVITNKGPSLHELVMEQAKDIDKAIHFNGAVYEAAKIKPHTTRTVVWTIPHAGQFKFACHVKDHYMRGMKTFETAMAS